jgi:hypothetical protein
MSACLQRSSGGPSAPIYAVCMSLASPIGRAWAALDRAVGRPLPGRPRPRSPWPPPRLAELAEIEAGAIRGTRPCDKITAPGRRRPRLTIASRGSGALPGELLSGTSRQPRDLTAPVPVRACPALRSPRLRRDPRSHGLPGHPRTFAVRAWQESCWSGCQGPCEQPLAPTATHNLSSFFELGHLPEPRYGIKP